MDEIPGRTIQKGFPMHPTLRRALTKSKLKSAAGLIYNSAVGLEVASFRVLNRLARTEKDISAGDLSSLTALIKTFERPVILKRLTDSLRLFYPDLKIIIVDDSKNPQKIDQTEYLVLPYDSGVSAGRSAGLKLVETPFTLLLDDDFIFYYNSGLRQAMQAICRHSEIDIMGGKVIKLPHFAVNDYRRAKIFPTSSEPVRPPGSYIGPFPVYDKVPNFYIARTDRLRLVDWDPCLKRQDHADFFTRARGILTSVYNKNLRCLHAQTPYLETYMRNRLNLENDHRILRLRYYADRYRKS
jgi:hypothetical protein